MSIVVGDNHIDFGPHAEVGKVHARFNREAGAREQSAVVVRFVIVHVHAVAVDGFAEAVSGAVEDVVSEASLVKHRARRAVNLPPTQIPAAAGRLFDERDGRIPGARNAPWNEPQPELPDGELVAYCGSGVTACVVLHRAYLRGRCGLLYPGSWSDWSNRSLPVERD